MRQILSLLVAAGIALVALPPAAAQCAPGATCVDAGASTASGAYACAVNPTYTCVSLAWITYGQGDCSTGATQLVFLGGSSVTPAGTAQVGVISFCGTAYYPDGTADTTNLVGYVILPTPGGDTYVPFAWTKTESSAGWETCTMQVGDVTTDCPAGLAPPFVYPGTLV